MNKDAVAKAIAALEADDMYPLDLYFKDVEKFGDYATPDEEKRIIYTDGAGYMVEVGFDGSVHRLVSHLPIPDDAPVPMWSDTPRGGVIGYMCKIDFECELGGTSAVIRTSAEKALCSGDCGVVEVEVIGRKVIVPGSFDDGHFDMDEVQHKAYVDSARKKVQEYDTEHGNK